MATAEKAATIAELADRFRASNAVVLTEYRGLTVKQLTALRNTIRDHGTYAVVKNTLTSFAAEQAGVSAFEGQLVGPSGIAFITGDPVKAAKGLREFARANPVFVLKSGLLDGKALSADEIGKLADLESREIVLAKLAGAMKASLTEAASLFAAPLSQAARVIEALRAQVASAAGPTQVASSTSSSPAAAVEAVAVPPEAGPNAVVTDADPAEAGDAATAQEAGADGAEAAAAPAADPDDAASPVPDSDDPA